MANATSILEAGCSDELGAGNVAVVRAVSATMGFLTPTALPCVLTPPYSPVLIRSPSVTSSPISPE